MFGNIAPPIFLSLRHSLFNYVDFAPSNLQLFRNADPASRLVENYALPVWSRYLWPSPTCMSSIVRCLSVLNMPASARWWWRKKTYSQDQTTPNGLLDWQIGEKPVSCVDRPLLFRVNVGDAKRDVPDVRLGRLPDVGRIHDISVDDFSPCWPILDASRAHPQLAPTN